MKTYKRRSDRQVYYYIDYSMHVELPLRKGDVQISTERKTQSPATQQQGTDSNEPLRIEGACMHTQFY